MSLDFFHILNFGIGVAFLILAYMALLHTLRGYRFNPRQEVRVLKLFGWSGLAFAVNFTTSAAFSTFIELDELDRQLALLLYIPLVAKLLGGFFLWLLIFWTLGWFYPSQR